eukprot:scaffold3428_cov379-Prasinococcus_capsulatus_cf.AAC.11
MLSTLPQYRIFTRTTSERNPWMVVGLTSKDSIDSPCGMAPSKRRAKSSHSLVKSEGLLGGLTVRSDLSAWVGLVDERDLLSFLWNASPSSSSCDRTVASGCLHRVSHLAIANTATSAPAHGG